MRMTSRSLLPSALLALALSACQDQSADPRLKTASPEALQERLRSTCQATQAKIQNASLAKVARGCDCYAGRTMKALDAGEVEEFHNSGVLGMSARDKALKAIDACHLQRP